MTPQAATLISQAPAPDPVEEAPTAPTAAAPAPAPALSPPPPPPVVRANGPSAGARRLSRRTALWLGLGCPLITAINIVIEPLPADPDAPVPVAASLVFLLFTASVVATSVYAARREVRVLPTAVFAGTLAVVLTITCPMSGHHGGIGWWWYTQMALSTGFLGFAAVSWRRHAAGR